MNCHIHLTISKFCTNKPFFFNFLKVEEKFCAPLYGQLQLFSAQEINFSQILNQQISIEINKNQRRYYVHGFVFEYVYQGQQYRLNDDYHSYVLQFASFVHGLKSKRYFRIFADQTIQQVIESLFEPYAKFIHTNIYIHDRKIRNYIQYYQSDFEFLHQLFKKYDIFYFFKATESIETILIMEQAYWIQSSVPHSIQFSDLRHCQIDYNYNQATQISATDNQNFLTIGMILDIENLNHKQWIVKHMIHTFKHLKCIHSSSFVMSATYENSFHAVDKDMYQTWKEVSSMIPNLVGAEKAIVVGSKDNNLKVTCLHTKYRSIVCFRRSELRQNQMIMTSFLPQKNQIVILIFGSEQLPEGIILGGLFQTKQSWPFAMNQEGISISSESNQQQICCDKKNFIIKSSGHLKQIVAHDYLQTIGENQHINIVESMCCACEQYTLDAQTIIGQVGSSSLRLNESGIQIKSKKILIN